MKKIILLFFLVFTGIAFSQTEERQADESIVPFNQVNAYPNPFKNKTTIYFTSNTNEEVTVRIQSILGKIVFFKKMQAIQGKNAIDFYKNKLSEGIYVYTVATKNNKISKRLVIK